MHVKRRQTYINVHVHDRSEVYSHCTFSINLTQLIFINIDQNAANAHNKIEVNSNGIL